jgi:hypothetical protein
MNTQQIIMDEIMQSVYTLAQDQYGNYVIQVSKIFQLIQHACIDWQVKFFAPKNEFVQLRLHYMLILNFFFIFVKVH